MGRGKRTLRGRLLGLSIAALAVAGLMLSAPTAGAKQPAPDVNPLIFVHGFVGSAAQFESQKLRFVENGYPASYVRAVEYDSTFSLNTINDVYLKIDALVAELQEETGRAQVDLAGHSLGTTVLQGYLKSSPARAANVAHYINIDGAQATSLPGGVPTLAIWAGRGTPGRTIVGATNVTVPDQTHVQSATSAESFAAMFTFLTGRDPTTTAIVPEPPGQVMVAGRALLFPQNVGVQNSTLRIWEVDPATGYRTKVHPEATYALSGDGSWGPVKLQGHKRYEFEIVRPGGTTHHFYYENFVRSDDFVRLLTGVPGSGLEALTDRSPDHVSVVVSRNKELWGDQGAENDVLELNGVNVVNAATCPLSHRSTAVFAYDKGSDGVSDVSTPLAAFFSQPFITGVDLFMPATPGGSVSIALTSRGAGPVRTVNIPAFPSDTDRVTVQLNDFER
jgi:pimeloyl-ACP methyl ester carboxylesterase